MLLDTVSLEATLNLARAMSKLKEHYDLPMAGSGNTLLSAQNETLADKIAKHPHYRLQETWVAEGNKGLCPEFFVVEMLWRWVRDLNNIATNKLEKLWFVEAETFNRLISAKPEDPWLILSPETGTGKTEGSCVYAALSAIYPDTGILFTTRLTSQCDAVVKNIKDIVSNHCARNPRSRGCLNLPRPIAVTIHSDQKPVDTPSAADIHNAPCLVITHERMSRTYKEVLENEGTFNDRGLERFSEISKWRKGTRIRITDEAPSGLVEQFQLDKYAFKALEFFLDDSLSPEARSQLEVVNCIRKACEDYWKAMKDAECEETAKVMALGDFLPKDDRLKKFILQELFKVVRSAPDSSTSVRNMKDRKKDAIDCLLAFQHVAKSWAVALSNIKGTPAATSAWLTCVACWLHQPP